MTTSDLATHCSKLFNPSGSGASSGLRSTTNMMYNHTQSNQSDVAIAEGLFDGTDSVYKPRHLSVVEGLLPLMFLFILVILFFSCICCITYKNWKSFNKIFDRETRRSQQEIERRHRMNIRLHEERLAYLVDDESLDQVDRYSLLLKSGIIVEHHHIPDTEVSDCNDRPSDLDNKEYQISKSELSLDLPQTNVCKHLVD